MADKNLLVDIGEYLVSLGLVTAGTYFRDSEPHEKFDVPIVIALEYGGAPSFTGADCAQRYIQIRAKAGKSDDARSKAWALHKALDNPLDREVHLTAERWSIIQALQTPFKLAVDSSTDVTFAFNISLITYRD